MENVVMSLRFSSFICKKKKKKGEEYLLHSIFEDFMIKSANFSAVYANLLN